MPGPTASNRSDRTAADGRRLFGGEALRASEDEDLPAMRRELLQGGFQIAKGPRPHLLGDACQSGGKVAFAGLHLPASPAALRAVEVAQDREQPRFGVRAPLETVAVGEGSHHRLVHQILGTIPVAAERWQRLAGVEETTGVDRAGLAQAPPLPALVHGAPQPVMVELGSGRYEAEDCRILAGTILSRMRSIWLELRRHPDNRRDEEQGDPLWRVRPRLWHRTAATRA